MSAADSISLNPHEKSLSFLITLFVIIAHIGLLLVGNYWDPTPVSKPRSKVIVQTISLKPTSSVSVQNKVPLTPNLPEPISIPLDKEEFLNTTSSLIADIPKEELVPLKEPLPPLDKIEEKPLLTPKIEKESPAILPESVPPEPPKPAPKAHPNKPIEKPSKPASSKPVEAPKTVNKKPVIETKKPSTIKPQATIEKKNQESVKKTTKTESNKSKTDDLEKKRQQEKLETEKKRKLEQEATKKKQQEIEAEKKKQELAAKEAEKKRQELLAAQEAAKQREQALLAKAKENLSKVSQTRDKMSSSSATSSSLATTTLPKEIVQLEVDALPVGELGSQSEWGVKEVSYSQEIATRLKLALKLPEYGTVKIKLTLDRSGKCLKIETIHSESHKNKTYAESKIPAIIFPAFGQQFQGMSQNTFVVTLQNHS